MHYEERLQKDLSGLDERVAAVAETVEQALKNAVYALLADDHKRAYSVVLGDLAVNRAIRDIDRRCHAFVARHLPSAGHLRRVSAVLRLDVELERIGDYAVSIARETVQLSEPLPAAVGRDIDLLADQTRNVLHDAVRSFLGGDAELARATKSVAYEVERTCRNMLGNLLDDGERGGRSVRDLFALLIVLNRLGRIVDQSKNICEDALFAATGETKQPKVYKILFVDERNDCASQIAAAIGRKAFPNSGEYDSAGWNPAESNHPALLGFMERKGHSLDRTVGSSLVSTAHELDDYHVIVSLDGDVRDHIEPTPFHTIFLDWSVASSPVGLDNGDADRALDVIYKQVAAEIEDLMIALRGEGAD